MFGHDDGGNPGHDPSAPDDNFWDRLRVNDDFGRLIGFWVCAMLTVTALCLFVHAVRP